MYFTQCIETLYKPMASCTNLFYVVRSVKISFIVMVGNAININY